MAEADAGKVTVEEVNLEELMEVITSYKCRFCDFTSTTTNDMAAHLHTVHITTSTAIATTSKSLSTLTSKSAVTNTELQSMPVISHTEHASLDPQTLTASAVLTESVSESTILAEPVSESAILADAVSESSALAVSESDVLPEPEPESNVLPDQVSASTVFAEPQLPLSGDSHENGVVEAASHSSSTYAAPVFFSNLGLTSNKTSPSHRSLVSPALPDPKVLTNQVRSVAKNLPVIPSSQSDLQLFSLNGNTAVRQSLPISSLQLTGSGLTLVSTALDSVPFVDHPKDLGTGPASIAPVTKELYLCGLCSMGFSSVEDCNGHMERDHQAQLQGASVSETVVNKFEQRTSVGTQATGKKPGRKRKSEMPPPSSPPPLRKGRDDTGHFVDDENDEDWIPGRTLSSGTRDGRQRRKIRAPKALKEDYVTEKKRTYRKRKLVAKESFPLECNYMGCPTKFLAPASLDIHHACHNKEDDAFTCIHCNQPFQFWKPLRIHLYRNHQVDCDMYQCDICQYKTDTLHKLGVHREIHSDNRPYTCDVCGKGFKQLSQMKNHQIIHAQHQRPGRESWFSNKTCEVCKRTFANSKCLKKHVEAVHGQNKPFQCQYCSHTTAWKAMLILHERTHTGEKPFKCDVCSYATGDHNSLRRHKMRHTGQRQYRCQLCSYTCIQTISLKTHMRNKHPTAQGVVYTCALCKFRTINKQIYDNHLEDHRNGLITPAKVEPVAAPDTPLTMTIDGVGTIIPEEPVQFQLQVKKMVSGELHANKEDIDKLNAIPQLVQAGMDANQLIYSALNVGTQVDGLSYTMQLVNGVQSTVLPSAHTAKDVLSAYSITFQAPQVLATQSNQSIVVDFRSLTEEAEPPHVSSVSQGVGRDDDGLGEGSNSTNTDSIEHTFYAQVPQMMDGESKGSFPASDVVQLQVCDKEDVKAEGVSTQAAVAVSETGVGGVIHNFIVMDAEQGTQSVTQGLGDMMEVGRTDQVFEVVGGKGLQPTQESAQSGDIQSIVQSDTIQSVESGTIQSVESGNIETKQSGKIESAEGSNPVSITSIGDNSESFEADDQSIGGNYESTQNCRPNSTEGGIDNTTDNSSRESVQVGNHTERRLIGLDANVVIEGEDDSQALNKTQGEAEHDPQQETKNIVMEEVVDCLIIKEEEEVMIGTQPDSPVV